MMGINFDQPVSLVYQPAILYGDVFIDSGYLWLIRLHISYTPGGSSRLTAIADQQILEGNSCDSLGALACRRWHAHGDVMLIATDS